jgi:hypothetical protein
MKNKNPLAIKAAISEGPIIAKVIMDVYIVICIIFAIFSVLLLIGLDSMISLSLKSSKTEEKSEINVVVIKNINRLKIIVI